MYVSISPFAVLREVHTPLSAHRWKRCVSVAWRGYLQPTLSQPGGREREAFDASSPTPIEEKSHRAFAGSHAAIIEVSGVKGCVMNNSSLLLLIFS